MEAASPGASRPGSSRPMSSRPSSRRPGSTSSRPRSGRSYASVRAGAASAGNIVRSLSATSKASRPSTAKSVAWSDEAEEQKKKEEEEAAERKKPAGPHLSKELEEELNRDSATKEDSSTGCWVSFTRFVSSLWDTTDMAVGEEREVMVRTTLREVLIYLVFLFILIFVTNSSMEGYMYKFTDKIRHVYKKAEEVRQVKEFWDFMEKEFIEGTFKEEWYNTGGDADFAAACKSNRSATGPCPIPMQERKILYASRLLGVPRMRQLRVRNNSCTIPTKYFKDLITVCYGDYSESIEDTADFAPSHRRYTSADAWRYQNVLELDSNTHNGQLTSYSGAGSVQNLRETAADTRDIIRELKEGLWIGRGTRYVTVDFTIYNANVNLFCVIKLSFEFPPTGGIVPDPLFNTVKLIRYITAGDFALAAFEIVFALFIVYYLIEEVIEIKVLRLDYFRSFWNIIDLFVIVVSIATLSFNIFLIFRVETLLKGLLAEPEKFADFTYLSVTSQTFQKLAAFTVFLGVIKIFKYISFNKTMSQLAGTLQRSAPDVGAFFIMFGIVFMAFAQFAFLMFGTKVKDFSTVTDACFTQFRLILGDFNFVAIEDANPFFGPVYFLLYIFFVFFILMNMFLAIINDTYSEVKEEVEHRKEDFQVVDMISRGYNNVREMVHTRDKLIDIQAVVKLAADDGVVTYDEIRDALRNLNFSDLEIEIFCAKYDKDGDFEFDVEELQAIGREDEDQFENMDHLTLESEKKENEEDVQRKMTKGEFWMVSKRVRHMEDDMTDVIEKVDQALKKMENIEGQVEAEADENLNGGGSRAGSARSRADSARSSASRAGSARSAID